MSSVKRLYHSMKKTPASSWMSQVHLFDQTLRCHGRLFKNMGYLYLRIVLPSVIINTFLRGDDDETRRHQLTMIAASLYIALILCWEKPWRLPFPGRFLVLLLASLTLGGHYHKTKVIDNPLKDIIVPALEYIHHGLSIALVSISLITIPGFLKIFG